ncbi:unnamed protein product [Brassica oleracea]
MRFPILLRRFLCCITLTGFQIGTIDILREEIQSIDSLKRNSK